jgi:hypothetical protein
LRAIRKSQVLNVPRAGSKRWICLNAERKTSCTISSAMSDGAILPTRVISQIRPNQIVRFRNKNWPVQDYFATFPGTEQAIQVRGDEKIKVTVGSARLHVQSHEKKRFVIALKYEGENEYRYIIASDLSWRTLDIVEAYTLRWLVEVFFSDWKGNEGWGKMTKQPGEEGSNRSLILSLLVDHFSSSVLMASLRRKEKTFYRHFERVLGEPEPVYDEPAEEILSRHHLRIEHTGEAMDNILKTHYLMKHHPDIALFVQANPSFCCAGLVTEAMAGEIEKHTGVPVVSITYDGTGGNKNEAIIPYMTYAGKARGRYPTRGEGKARNANGSVKFPWGA